MFECVINVSEGQRLDVLEILGEAAGASLRDFHSDEVHNRSVFTLIHHRDELRHDVHAFADATMNALDLREHVGVHPRFGVLDVVPYVALDESKAHEALALRDETAAWVAAAFNIPVFLYGPFPDGFTRSLPDVRREAFRTLRPDLGPETPDPILGSSAVGARNVLVAWNLWMRDISLDEGKAIAATVRCREVRALAFSVGAFVQISCNLIEPLQVGPSTIYDQVLAVLDGGVIDHAELVGLVPEGVLRTTDRARWDQLDLSYEKTIEARLA